ncbi:MAG TPA: NAD(+) diphosphatase [Dongiaceae bacterium]|nr:NAD(+) diphosphatase [Dongiaceae bacterium]
MQDPLTRLHLTWRGRNLILTPTEPQAHFLALAQHQEVINRATTLIFLGRMAETAYFVADISDLDEDAATAFGQFLELRNVGQLVPQRDGALMGYARGLMHWHERHRFCGKCGSPTTSEAAGHQRRCGNPDCGLVHFPRLDPAVIMRITHRHPQLGERILMARQAAWAPGMHSVLAGFVETGETLEAAVARETLEEAGLLVKNVRYFASQPWPFPSSLMLGFTAEALSDEIQLDNDELQSARWLTRGELHALGESDRFRLPRADSISRQLIAAWLRQRD